MLRLPWLPCSLCDAWVGGYYRWPVRALPEAVEATVAAEAECAAETITSAQMNVTDANGDGVNGAGPGPGPGPGPGGGGPRWSCKLVVQAESLRPEFPTVAKIVGANGANMDYLRSRASCNVQLRGRGSGQMEPDTGREAQEPMFLWIASEAPQNGKDALEMAQDLLKSVYKEHQGWCQRHNLERPPFREPTAIESIAVPSSDSEGDGL
jgi:hypothetical protein